MLFRQPVAAPAFSGGDSDRRAIDNLHQAVLGIDEIAALADFDIVGP
ncbi:Uncharacterised protein [Mycobacterium tuberculosis]|nr:Uncharacterised protein [Mycobacterium tuberculosis]